MCRIFKYGGEHDSVMFQFWSARHVALLPIIMDIYIYNWVKRYWLYIWSLTFIDDNINQFKMQMWISEQEVTCGEKLSANLNNNNVHSRLHFS